VSPAAPPSPSAAPALDALASLGEPTPRVRVRDALRRLVASPDWARASWTVRQNRLLDEVGSDLRPLVALLVRAGEGGVVDGLPASPAGWPAARGSLVVALTAHSFLLPEMARWAVECWGFAAGVAPEESLTVAADARVAAWREAERRAELARAAAARASAERAAAERVAAERVAAEQAAAARDAARRAAADRPGGPAPARAVTASLAGTGGPAAASHRAATAPPAAPPAGRAAPRPALGGAPARRRGRMPEGLDNPVAHVSLAGIAVFVGYVLYGAVRLPTARATEVPRAWEAGARLPSGAALAGAPNVAAASPGIPGVTTNGLPQTPEDSARMIRVIPARRPTFALEQAPAPGSAAVPTPPVAVVPPVAPAGPAGGARAALAAVPAPEPAAAPTRVTVPAAPDGYDRLRLRDGRLVRGRVELVRVSAVVFRDADSGLRYEYPKSDVDAVITEFGSVVRFSPAERPSAVASGPSGATGAGAGAAERAAARVVRRGVGGRYEVTFSVVSVNGSPECQRGWQTPPRPDWARVAHVPGADTLAIAFEGGATFASVIDGEGQFASTFVIVPDQAYSGQALTTRLNGRFAEGGFDAAVNLVGYRRVSAGRDVSCHTVLRAVGRLAR
jgi:hypothetical protein